MRSCAAMLSVQREFRRHCPAEVDMLPVLDFAEVKTIAGWRKLRQLCHEWGKFYHLRIRAFSAQFFSFLCAILGDLMVGMLVPDTWSSGVKRGSARLDYTDLYCIGRIIYINYNKNNIIYIYMCWFHDDKGEGTRQRCEEYRDLSGVNLASLLVAGLVSTSLMVSILLLVYLGNEDTISSMLNPLRCRSLQLCMAFKCF